MHVRWWHAIDQCHLDTSTPDHQALPAKYVLSDAAPGASTVAELLQWTMTHSATAAAAAPAYAGDCSSDDDLLDDPFACDDGFLRDITSSFLQLPGAQDMPSTSISSILICGMQCSSLDVMYDESQLLQLPGAQQFGSEVLCDLLKEAGSLTPWRRRANLLSAMGR